MSFSSFLDQCRQRVDHILAEHITHYSSHQRLQEAMRYSLLNGGKRVRPILVYASANTLADIETTDIETATDSAAVAVEAIHAYSLIHDDLPAMDDDDLRRGKPTCHIAFNEATAILAGDALQALAFDTLANIKGTISAKTTLAMIASLAHGSGANGMVAGQSLDLSAVEQTPDVEQLETMHRLKTGALINTSVRLGALSTGIATATQLQALSEYADAIGLAFQVQDDILDVISDTETLGKQQGADMALNKPTYVSLLGLDGAKIKVQQLHEQALDSLNSFDSRADYLRHLSEYIVNRNH